MQLKVRKPKAIMFDLIGTVVKTGFIEKVLFSYMRATVDDYLTENWGDRVLMRDIELLRMQSQMDEGPAIVRPGQSVDRIRNSVADYVVQCLNDLRDNEAIRVFRFHMLFDGYNRDRLKTHVYSDVAICLASWAAKDNIDLYVLSNGWTYAMQKFLKKTNHADLTLIIKEYLDTEAGSLDDSKTYESIIAKLGHLPEDILFLTHSGVEGVAAHRAGLSVILVTTHRDDLARERNQETRLCGLPYCRSFTEIIFTRDAMPASTMGSTIEDGTNSNSQASSAGSSASSSCAPSKGSHASSANGPSSVSSNSNVGHGSESAATAASSSFSGALSSKKGSTAASSSVAESNSAASSTPSQAANSSATSGSRYSGN